MVLFDLMGPRSHHTRSCDVIVARPKGGNQTFCFHAPPKEICFESVLRNTWERRECRMKAAQELMKTSERSCFLEV